MTLAIAGLLILLSTIQSLFGVGILLFGTPILLISGHDYPTTLMFLLPASAALSWSQIWDFRSVKLDGGYRKKFFLICVPLLIAGMIFAKQFQFAYEIKILVTIMLFLAFIIRSSAGFRAKFQSMLKNNISMGLGSVGIIHGVSNMGGSILTPLVSSIYSEKKKVLAGVSFDYAFMASMQLFVLLAIQGTEFHTYYLVGSLISLSTRYLIGKRVFSRTSEIYYQRLINCLILANAVVLGWSLFSTYSSR